MRKVKIEIPIILLTIVMLALMALSGNLVYKSLSEIVNSMLAESHPDNKLLLVKDANSDLNEMENVVKLYALSEKKSYLNDYYEINNSLESKLTDIKNTAIADSLSRPLLDSMITLSQQKMVIWKNILNLHLSKKNEHESFNQYFETLDTVMVLQDTIRFEEPEKRGFFKRVFGKQPEPPKPVIVDRTVEKQILRQEMQDLEAEIRQRNQEMSTMETAYLQKNLQVNEALSAVIARLELKEQESLLLKSQEADSLATETYERLVQFAGSLILLMILVLFLFFRDLRKSRAYQKALREAKTQAENLARTKELFVATVSHEMRTPVNAIHGLSEQLLQQKHDAKTERDLQVIFESTQHLTELVNDTFDFTRIENQRLQLNPIDFSLSELLDKLEFYNRKSTAAKNIRFELEKNFDESLVLFGDEGRLKQILNNLLTNAIKFTDAGLVKLKADAKAQEENILLSFEISDTGIGIAEESQKLIFNDFVQLDTDINKKSGGTGLGLYIVKKLVELLNGEITLKSQLGLGTVINVNLPFTIGDRKKLQKNIESYPAPSGLKNKKVLLVDDDEFNRHLLKNIFNKWKIDFDEAENGKQAVELSERNVYTLILMDIRMPVMNGTEAAQKIKASGNAAKIIALSANTGNETLNSTEHGFDSAMEKPFTEAALYHSIQKVLGQESEVEKPLPKKTEGIKPDLSELERMGNGDSKFLQEMITLFISSSENSLQAMQENLAGKNFQAIADLAHKLAAPVKYMNVLHLYNKVKSLQNTAENNPDVGLLENMIAELKLEIETLNAELTTLLNKISV